MIDNPNLAKYWNKPVSELVALRPSAIGGEQQERHRLYALLLMALVYHYWNGSKRGRAGTYPLNASATPGGSNYFENDYLGHNIAALAVDAEGRIIDFEFNHNALFNSSAEHAEARLIRRVYSLTSVHDSWKVSLPDAKVKDDYNSFEGVTVYTSLESCAQCAGVMALARVKEVVYLQTDPGMYMIGNILRNLTLGTKLESPLPIAASAIGMPYFAELDRRFDAFKATVSNANPFFIPSSASGTVDASKSITSFLCTKAAYEVYREAYHEFIGVISGKQPLQHPAFAPRVGANTANTPLKNADILGETASFFSYATLNGRRATPHH